MLGSRRRAAFRTRSLCILLFEIRLVRPLRLGLFLISAKITESILICVKRFFLPFSLACAFAEFSGDLRPVAHGGTQALGAD
jgi:hypothetical protein